MKERHENRHINQPPIKKIARDENKTTKKARLNFLSFWAFFSVFALTMNSSHLSFCKLSNSRHLWKKLLNLILWKFAALNHLFFQGIEEDSKATQLSRLEKAFWLKSLDALLISLDKYYRQNKLFCVWAFLRVLFYNFSGIFL